MRSREVSCGLHLVNQTMEFSRGSIHHNLRNGRFYGSTGQSLCGFSGRINCYVGMGHSRAPPASVSSSHPTCGISFVDSFCACCIGGANSAALRLVHRIQSSLYKKMALQQQRLSYEASADVARFVSSSIPALFMSGDVANDCHACSTTLPSPGQIRSRKCSCIIVQTSSASTSSPSSFGTATWNCITSWISYCRWLGYQVKDTFCSERLAERSHYHRRPWFTVIKKY